MKFPTRYEIGVALLVTSAIVGVVAVWASRAAHEGGFPFFSMATLRAIWPALALLMVGSLAILLAPRRPE